MSVEREQPRGQQQRPALERLEEVERIIITPNVEGVEATMGFDMDCKYSVSDGKGVELFTVSEATNCCLRQLCGAERPFGMSFTVEGGTQVMYIERPYRGCCFSCCFQHLSVEFLPGTTIGHVAVESLPGITIGHVVQDWSFIRPRFSVLDRQKQPVLSIAGPFLTCRCFEVDSFEILDVEHNEPIGWIKKNYSESADESVENVAAKFPVDLDVQKKALLISACFLIAAMFFDQ